MSETRELFERLVLELERRAEPPPHPMAQNSMLLSARQAAFNALGDTLRAVLAEETGGDDPDPFPLGSLPGGVEDIGHGNFRVTVPAGAGRSPIGLTRKGIERIAAVHAELLLAGR